MVGSALVSGLGLGSMYGLLALGFYVTYSVSNTVNFAQGSSMMLGAVLCYTFAVTWKMNPALSIVLALALCGVWGMLVERVAVRPFVVRGSNAWLMATVALGIVIAPLFNVSSDMGTLFGIKAFAVAIVGGITSPWGVVIAGLCYGIIEALITALAGSTYTQIVTFAVVIGALALMPDGLFGRAS